MQHNVCSALGFDGLFHRIFGVALARPVHSFGVVVITLAEDLNLVADHERTIESQTEVTDDSLGFVLILIDELFGAGECDLVDVLIHFLGSHAYAMIADGEGLLILINTYTHAHVAEFAFERAGGGESLEFLRGIHSVADHLTQEDLVIRIQKFLDDGENVVRRYPNVSFAHICSCLILVESIYA